MDAIRTRLRPKWRSALKKAEGAGLTLEWSLGTTRLPVFLAQYAADQATKGYSGAAPKTLQALATRFGEKTAIALVYAGDLPAAGLLLFSHGRSATWQAGWVTEQGRRTSANNFALWEAIGRLKGDGIDWLDLGGINRESAAGVKRFKTGLGGREITLPGPYA